MKFNGSKLVMFKEGRYFHYDGGKYIEVHSVAAGMVVDSIRCFDWVSGEPNLDSIEEFENLVKEYVEELGKE
jgi:hypothetical protein